MKRVVVIDMVQIHRDVIAGIDRERRRLEALAARETRPAQRTRLLNRAAVCARGVAEGRAKLRKLKGSR